ncbi:DUF4116 domain-containing protein [Mycoplasmopsis cynos]|uniref:DUF4116 domain-containing protein n=1 Tax=Mycoplasmopsis cynos TaxID=171284 RepID=UPI003A5C8645
MLEFTSNDLRDNKSFVERAVSENGLAIKYAFERLKKDKEIILKAIESNGLAIQYILK